MKKENIDAVKQETKRFMARIVDFEKRLKRKKAIYGNEFWPIAGCKETAAIKRSSLDLTRALARMRNE